MDRRKEIIDASADYFYEQNCHDFNGIDENFIAGAHWAENNPSIDLLMKVFWIFDNNGLIDKNLSFDTEHFMETVVKYHWKDYDEKGRIKV